MKGGGGGGGGATTEPPDDWGDGSWTVDCVCGVNFDDGEEMVNCDECGVWVHTRCSRFVKGDASFSCDKCKSEETEVAQLLVELPVRLDNPPPPPPSSVSAPPSRAIRLWTDIPMEEKVHVHGLPGGDPALFQGLSSVFTSELWKYTGYVPKKFNFQYKEFPCWDGVNNNNARNDEDIENTVDRGADALFSMSKENVSFSPVQMLVGLRGSLEGVGCERKSSSKERKRREDRDSSAAIFQNGVRRERTHVRSVGVNLNKRKKDSFGRFKDQTAKKKVRRADNEANHKRRVSASTIDVTFKENGEKKATETNFVDKETQDGSEIKLPDAHFELTKSTDKPVENLSPKACDDHDLSKEATGHILQYEATLDSEKLDDHDPQKTERSPKIRDVSLPLLGINDTGKNPVQEESNMVVDVLDHLVKHDPEDHNENSSSVATNSQKLKPPVEDLWISAPVGENNHMLHPNGGMSPCSKQPITEVKTEAVGDQPRGDSILVSSPTSDIKVDEAMHLDPHRETFPTAMSSENLSVHDSSICSSPSIDYKAHDIDRDSEAAFSFDRKNNPEERIFASGESLKHKLELKETYSGPKHSLKHVEEPSQIGVEKSPCTEVTNKSSSLRRKAPKEPVSPSKQRSVNQLGPTRSGSPVVDCNLESRSQALEPYSIKKDHKENGTLRDTTRHEQLRKISKEHSRVSASLIPKTSYTRRASHASTSTGTSSELKEHVLCSSLKASVVEHVVSTLPCSNDLSPSQKVDMLNHSSIHQPNKANHASSSMHPPAPVNSSTPLSDEELALLLHQELNSSPRVPRVPRVRQAANMPQLSSPTATGIHTKRAFSSGGKDQISVSRRKNKEDLPKDTFRNSRELNDESKQIGRFPSSPDGRLLNEIMSKGERMTYEELCNAVLPHWHKLRKHNGERYAYSSHSQAVLDCLRNRNEWAQLVDRGPKTNTGRKRRKLDPEPPMVESEENEHENGRTSKELDSNGVECLHREEYPKGKRKARKRRRLALQGRDVKDATKRGKGDTITDDENEPFSPSSEGTENNSSEDESQGANKTSPLVSEASTSSGETVSMS
ncbi:hypothetical protein GIB67_001638 [Kingdonia uniflora]|uniref:Zinc finger PHD-type domain-containing protein n=1 Tax=Kingdonia uniflora TaxID=39325 RepID=A0A7J7L0W4_9MAGN|nr:hypothetical protein GIB67_001638 [Kingdonia uniflora]